MQHGLSRAEPALRPGASSGGPSPRARTRIGQGGPDRHQHLKLVTYCRSEADPIGGQMPNSAWLMLACTMSKPAGSSRPEQGRQSYRSSLVWEGDAERAKQYR
jgi:hypothetical protein